MVAVALCDVAVGLVIGLCFQLWCVFALLLIPMVNSVVGVVAYSV